MHKNPYASYISSIKSLGKTNNHTAFNTLRRIAAIVKPLLTKRAWKVGTLAEFYPRQQNLLGLNINHGAEIRIRLRCPHNESQFLPWDTVLGTMLHELVHIVRGPHDAVFYKLLDELTLELDAAMRNGWAGEGFDAPGSRVGLGVSHNLPPHQARVQALDSAEKRRKLSAHSAPPERLGGRFREVERWMDPRDLAGLAAERRAARDGVWCASDEAGISAFASPATAPASASPATAPASASPATAPASASPANTSPPIQATIQSAIKHVNSATQSNSATQKSVNSATQSNSATQKSVNSVTALKNSAEWTCNECTLLNPKLFLQCDACGTPRETPKKPTRIVETNAKIESGWYCPACFHHVQSDTFRMCPNCKFLRQV